MDIRVFSGDHDKLIDTLHNRIDRSRFTIEGISHKSKNVIKIHTVRLRESKPYCGNHPGACLVDRPHRNGKWLEGQDWVEFNDIVNDVCDELYVSANIRTTVCIVRKDTRRRTYYGMHYLNAFNNEWNRDEADDCYEDFCGKAAPMSESPYGTPGLYLRGV